MPSEYGIDVGQLRKLIIRPTIMTLGLWSEAAENLLVGTALTESRARYLAQLGSGPALGPFQMEPATHDDLHANFLRYRPDLLLRLTSLAIGTPDANEMAGNLYYAAAMCRIHYRRFPEALPVANDANALAAYWKKYYNTELGKGTVEGALPHFEAAVE